MKLRFLLHTLTACAICYSAAAQLLQHRDVSDLQPYKPQQHASGTIRVYGNNYIPALMKSWEEGF